MAHTTTVKFPRRIPYPLSLKATASLCQLDELQYWHDSLKAHETLVTAFNSPVTTAYLIDSLFRKEPFYLQTPLRFAPPVSPFSDRAVYAGFIWSFWEHLRPSTDPSTNFRFRFDPHHLIVEEYRGAGWFNEVQRYLLHTIRLELLVVDDPLSDSSVKKALVVNVTRRPR